MSVVFGFVAGFLAVVGRDRGPVFISAAVLALGTAAVREILALRRTDMARQWRRMSRVSAVAALAMIVAGVAFADAGKASRDPLRATAEYEWSDRDGLMYAMAEPPAAAERARIERARGYEAVEATLAESPAVRIGGMFDADGITTAYSRVRVTLRGNRDEPVLVEGIRAAADCGPPLDGALFYGPPQGEEDVVDIAFDLDSDDLNAREPDRGGLPTSTLYADEHFITLRPDEPVVLHARAYTASQHCSWEIHLDIQGEEKPQIIGAADGNPFEITAPAEAPYAATFVLDYESMAFVEGPLPDWVNQG